MLRKLKKVIVCDLLKVVLYNMVSVKGRFVVDKKVSVEIPHINYTSSCTLCGK